MADRRTSAIVAGLVGTAIVATAVATRAFGAGTPAPTAAITTGTFTVARTTVTSRQQVNGTLGYGPVTTIVAPQGTTAAQLAQAQSSYDAAAVQVRNAERAVSEGGAVTSAEATLRSAEASYRAARASAASLMDRASRDTTAYRTALDAIFSRLDAVAGALPLYGSDARVAQAALYAALTPINNARADASRLLGPASGENLQARNALDVAIAAFEAAYGSDADTSAQAAAFSSALTTWSATAARVRQALDATNGPLGQVASSVAAAQAALTTPSARYNTFFDASRTDLAALAAAVADEQQLAAAAKDDIDRSSTSVGVVASAIGGGLDGAKRSVATAAQQEHQGAAMAHASVESARTQASSAWNQLTGARANAAIGAGTFTWLPRPGALVARGEPLYAVDGRPIPLLIGVVPMYRSIGLGASGDDVRQLEDNLVALGFNATTDGTFDAADSDTLRSWESAAGIPATGDLPNGAVVFAPAPVRIAALRGTVGSAYLPGQPTVDVTDAAHVVTVALDASLQTKVRAGDSVTVQLAGQGARALTGKVSEVSGIAQAAAAGQGQGPVRATVNVTVRLDDPSAAGSLDQAPVRVSIVDQVRTNVLAVPVTSLIAKADGTFFVRVIHGTQRDEVTVVPGVFGDSGLVEVTGALAVGDQIETPRAP